MAPFIAASGITFYLVSTMQEMGVRCEPNHLLVSALTDPIWFSPSGVVAEAYAKDPKNPYAAQIAKETHH